MNKLIAVLLLGSVAVTGCADKNSVSGQNSVTVRSDSYIGYVSEIYLEDGTRCAVMMGYYKGGLSCDWSGPKKNQF